jgi:hypothetical protein
VVAGGPQEPVQKSPGLAIVVAVMGEKPDRFVLVPSAVNAVPHMPD